MKLTIYLLFCLAWATFMLCLPEPPSSKKEWLRIHGWPMGLTIFAMMFIIAPLTFPILMYRRIVRGSFEA